MLKEIVEQELINNNIEVLKWTNSSCGVAYINTRQIKIPIPVDYDTLGVCFHEIGHIVLNHGGKNSKPRFIEEYEAEQYAIQKLKEYNRYNIKFELRAIAHVLSKIAQAKNRRMNINKVPQEIVSWTGLQKRKWKKASKVWVNTKQVNKRKEILIRFYYY